MGVPRVYSNNCAIAIERDDRKCYWDLMHDRSDITLPDDLPVPIDDRASEHFAGTSLPSIPLSSTDGEEIDLAGLRGTTVVDVYPRTGRPDLPASPRGTHCRSARMHAPIVWIPRSLREAAIARCVRNLRTEHADNRVSARSG